MTSDVVTEKIDKYRQELISYLKEVYDFHKTDDVQDVMKTISAYRARASLIREGIVQSSNPKFNRFRIDELDPFLSEMKEQFAIWSRISSIRKDEWDMTRG